MKFTQKDIHTLKELLEQHCGLQFTYNRETNLLKNVEKRVKILGLSKVSEYIFYLFEKGDEEFYNLVNLLTINETYFFRHKPQFDLLTSIITSQVHNKYSNEDLFIWSSGCSIGAEPYSIAICLKELADTYNINLKIFASDIDSTVIETARKGIFSKRSVTAEMPEYYKEKYFQSVENNYYKIDDDIKKMVVFRKHNLKKDVYPYKIDYIFCRNVLIYFNEINKSQIIKKMHATLNTDGCLFLSPVEFIPNYFKSYFSKIYGRDDLKAFRKWDTDRRAYEEQTEFGYYGVRKPLETHPYPEIIRRGSRVFVIGVIAGSEREKLLNSEILFVFGQLNNNNIKSYILDLTKLKYISNNGIAIILEKVDMMYRKGLHIEKILLGNEYMKEIWYKATNRTNGNFKLIIDDGKQSTSILNQPITPINQNLRSFDRVNKENIPVLKKKSAPLKSSIINADKDKLIEKKEPTKDKVSEKNIIKIGNIKSQNDIRKYNSIFMEILEKNIQQKIVVDMTEVDYVEQDFFIILKRFISARDSRNNIKIVCPEHIELWLKKFRLPEEIIQIK